MNQQPPAFPPLLGEVRASHYGGDVWVVSLTGEHDLSNVGDLDERLEEVHTHGTRVVLDLAEASFIDSTVVTRVVREAAHAARTLADDLAVVAPAGSQARRVLELIQVGRVRIVESRDDALRAMGAGSVVRDPMSEW